jgi:hypothetical protein
VLPSINRQLIDLYVTLLYILDDFIPRVEQYQQSGWKDIKKHVESEIEKHGHDPVWANYISAQQSILVASWRACGSLLWFSSIPFCPPIPCLCRACHVAEKVSAIVGAMNERDASLFAAPRGFLPFLGPSLLHHIRQTFATLRREAVRLLGWRGRKIGSGG